MFSSFPPSSRCSRARELISLGLDDLLDEVQRIELTAHLGSCADCLRHQDVLERGRAALQNAFAEPSENFEWKVQLGIQRALRERAAVGDPVVTSFWRPVLASAAAVALLVVGAGSFWLRGDGSAVQGREAMMAGRPALTSSLVVEAAAPEVAPDLSGAIPGRVFEMDATRDGFGIRTVSRTSVDPRFSGDLYAPVRDAGWARETVGRDATVFPSGRATIPWNSGAASWQMRRDGVQVLNLRLRGSTLPAARSQTGAVPESTASAANPR